MHQRMRRTYSLPLLLPMMAKQRPLMAMHHSMVSQMQQRLQRLLVLLAMTAGRLLMTLMLHQMQRRAGCNRA